MHIIGHHPELLPWHSSNSAQHKCRQLREVFTGLITPFHFLYFKRIRITHLLPASQKTYGVHSHSHPIESTWTIGTKLSVNLHYFSDSIIAFVMTSFLVFGIASFSAHVVIFCLICLNPGLSTTLFNYFFANFFMHQCRLVFFIFKLKIVHFFFKLFLVFSPSYWSPSLHLMH